MNTNELNSTLEKYYKLVDKIVLTRQDPITGLLPASTAITAHGDYTDAWVRDNVYSILCVWGLALSYKKYKPDNAKNAFAFKKCCKAYERAFVFNDETS